MSTLLTHVVSTMIAANRGLSKMPRVINFSLFKMSEAQLKMAYVMMGFAPGLLPSSTA